MEMTVLTNFRALNTILIVSRPSSESLRTFGTRQDTGQLPKVKILTKNFISGSRAAINLIFSVNVKNDDIRTQQETGSL